jgi:hypothetical protein
MTCPCCSKPMVLFERMFVCAPCRTYVIVLRAGRAFRPPSVTCHEVQPDAA